MTALRRRNSQFLNVWGEFGILAEEDVRHMLAVGICSSAPMSVRRESPRYWYQAQRKMNGMRICHNSTRSPTSPCMFDGSWPKTNITTRTLKHTRQHRPRVNRCSVARCGWVELLELLSPSHARTKPGMAGNQKPRSTMKRGVSYDGLSTIAAGAGRH